MFTEDARLAVTSNSFAKDGDWPAPAGIDIEPAAGSHSSGIGKASPEDNSASMLRGR